MTEQERQDKIFKGLVMLLMQVDKYFEREDAGAEKGELVILKGLLRKRKDSLLDLLEKKNDNIIQFPGLRD